LILDAEIFTVTRHDYARLAHHARPPTITSRVEHAAGMPGSGGCPS
jgi:hypothetical protein